MTSTGGIQALTMERLAAACNLSKGGLYHYFGNKEDLLYELMADGLADRAQKACTRFESGFDVATLTAAMTDKVLDQSPYKRLYALMVLQAMTDPVYDRALRSVEGRFWDQAITSMLGGVSAPQGVEGLFTLPMYWLFMSLMVGEQFFDRASKTERHELVAVVVRAVVEYSLQQHNPGSVV